MMDVVHNKLVRDKIPAIVKADGKVPVSRVLDDEEYRMALRDKLVEEAAEVQESQGDLGEYADALEVLQAAVKADGYMWEQVEEARIEKVRKRGGFDGRVFLETVRDV